MVIWPHLYAQHEAQHARGIGINALAGEMCPEKKEKLRRVVDTDAEYSTG
jgi:hypothetical protein